MKKICIYLVFLFSNAIFAQLYVSPNSFVYVRDQYVFVNQDVNLQSNGAIYLRNESQLLQGTTGTSTNRGQGVLSVYQEGTSDNFDYNYWCSPVGNASSSVGNESFGIGMISRPTSTTASTPAILTSDLDGIANPLTISNYWIWKFLSSSTYSQWFYVGSSNSVAAGEGFTMKGTSGTDATTVDGTQNNTGSAQRYDFRGKPNDGTIPVNVANNNFTLTGNPYPSALHVNAFLLESSNSACNRIAYYWEQNKATNSHFLINYQGGYGTFSPVSLLSNGVYVPATFNTYNPDGSLNTVGASSGLVIERKYAPIGQGFMVRGASNGSVSLMNSHRVFYRESEPLSQFERNANSQYNSTSEYNGGEAVPHIRFNVTYNDLFTAQMALILVPQATDGIDGGIDALSPNDSALPNDAYFFLENDRYIIQGVDFDVTKRIPVGVKSTDNTTFKFEASMVINFDETQMIYLFDKETNTYHDIKNDSFVITLPTGVYNDRFEITFQNQLLGIEENTNTSLYVFQNNTIKMLTISNPKQLDLTSVVLYDINGKQVFNETNLGSNSTYQFSTSRLSDAVYLVYLMTKDKHIEKKKIIISNNSK
jgi:hypothetical protein